MNKISTNLQDCYILEPARFGDARGYFSAPYIEKEYPQHSKVNIAHSASKA